MGGAVVAAGVVDQVLLMVAVGGEKVFLGADLELGDDFLALGVKVLLLHFVGHFLGNIHLLLIVCKDRRSVLCASVVALTVELGRVMRAVEELNQLSIRNLGLLYKTTSA